MLDIKEVVDIVRRRCRFTLEQYDVATIYAEKKQDKVKLYIHLNTDLDKEELTKLAVKYNHIFDDVSDTFTISVKNNSDFISQKFMWVVWKKGAGYLFN